MATLIKNTAFYGFFLTEDEDANLLTNNTPGEIDLSLITEGTDYVKLNRPLRDREREDNKYASVWNVIDGKKNYTSYGDQDEFYEITHTIKESTVALTYAAKEKFKLFFKKHRKQADDNIYLINRIGSDTWEQFYTAGGVAKKYQPILVRTFAFNREYSNDNLKINVIATVEAIWSS